MNYLHSQSARVARMFLWGSCCSNIRFLCNILWFIVCRFYSFLSRRCIICTFLVWTFLDFLVLFSIPSLCLYNKQDLVCICLGYFVSTFYRLPNIMFYLSWYINGMFLFLNVLLTTRCLTSTLISWYINNHWLFFHYVSHF